MLKHGEQVKFFLLKIEEHRRIFKYSIKFDSYRHFGNEFARQIFNY